LSTEELLADAAHAIDSGDDARAIEALGDVLTRDPEHPLATWHSARFLGRKGALSEAAEQFSRAVRLDRELSRVEFALRGEVMTLADVPGSTMPAMVLDELGRGMYDLANRNFAQGDVVLDIGAHIGAVSIVLARLNPHLTIYAYEPARSNYAMLTANLAANRVTNVHAIREAIAGSRGTLELLWSADASAGATAYLSPAARDRLGASGWLRESVNAVTLDDVFERHGITRCAFLKLDCEGAEWDVARSSESLARVDRMALELHAPFSRHAEGAEAVQREFASLLTSRAQFPETVIASTVWINSE